VNREHDIFTGFGRDEKERERLRIELFRRDRGEKVSGKRG
jgi:hypothetical protein